MKEPLVILTGPTSVGKTEISIQLAKMIDGEIISADSIQVYKRMNIGSAKISEEEKQSIPHYLIDELEPWEDFNVTVFQKKAKEAIKEIRVKNKIPIIVGGTGFYIQSVLFNIDFTENEEDDTYRNMLYHLAEKNGNHILHEMLEKVDPESALLIHENNMKRVVRALEFYHMTGKKISEHNETERKKESPYQYCYFVLNDNREKIYNRINQRVDQMINAGLVQEVQSLLKEGCTREMISMQGLGYKEIAEYMEHEISLEEAIYRIKRDTRHFAKRQITWFKRERDVIWLQKENKTHEMLLEEIMSHLRENNIL